MSSPGHSASPSRGFTLLELMVSSVITVLIMAAVGAAFVAVQGSFEQESQIKSSVEGSRVATSYLERVVRYAGYGVDPRYAFSFSTTGLPSTTKDNYSATTAAPGNVPFITDDLAFRYRDPSFLRRGTLNSGITSISLIGTPSTIGVALSNNQPMMVACHGSSDYVVLKATSGSAPTDTSITVAQYGSPFPVYASGALPACLTSAGANPPFVMLMYDVRLRVVDLGGRPFLVAFHNFTSGDPTADTDFDPVAADVENFQVAYVMNRPAATSTCCSALGPPDSSGNSDWIMGDSGDSAGTIPVDNATWPSFDTNYDDPLRFDSKGANIRALRISIVTRSPRQAAKNRPQEFKPFSPVENSAPASTAGDGYYRTIVTTSIRVPNMSSRTFFTPPLYASDQSQLNKSGG